MDNRQKSTNNIFGIFLEKKGIAFVVILLFCGLLLMYLQGGIAKKKDKMVYSDDFDIESYVSLCEKKLQNITDGVCGGKSRVMVTLESSYESVFANNAAIDESGRQGGENVINTKKEIVLRSTAEKGDEPVVVKKIMPKIKGVVIVCDGGNNEVIRRQIKEAAMCAFNITDDKICVTGSK